jgi:hypothetical protein
MNSQLAHPETEIISAISSVPATILPGKGDGIWTTAIKRSLITLGRTKGYDVCASGFPNECHGEWLFDLIWYRNEPQEHLREIGLIMESELSIDPLKIKYDFEKLLAAKAPIKVMVFQDYQNNLPTLWSLLETGIRNFQTRPANEKYILAGYENAKDAFSFKAVTA